MNEMYRINVLYKIQLINNVFYTGQIIGMNETSVKIKTIKEEEIVLNKNSILQARILNEGGRYGKKETI